MATILPQTQGRRAAANPTSETPRIGSRASRSKPFDQWFTRFRRKCSDCRRWCYGATGGTTPTQAQNDSNGS
jgi:hypothetical protein